MGNGERMGRDLDGALGELIEDGVIPSRGAITNELATRRAVCTKCGIEFEKPVGQRQNWCPSCAATRDAPYQK